MDQSFNSCFIIALLSAIFVGVTFADVADSVNQLNLWKAMLPSTPMPRALREALPNQDDARKVPDQGFDGETTLSHEPLSSSEFLHHDCASSMFFLEKDMIPGTKLNIHFKSNMQGPAFLSTLMAQKMPSLTSENLPQLLQFFSVSSNSKQANIMNQTIAKCEHPDPKNDQIQFCATSIRQMVTRVISELGAPQNIKAVSMPAIHADAVVPYKVMDARELAADTFLIVCHKMSFPVGLYYCHQPRGAAAYAVSLERMEDGARIGAYAICHYHTSAWSPENVAFKTLDVKPGSTICHFNELDNVIWYLS